MRYSRQYDAQVGKVNLVGLIHFIDHLGTDYLSLMGKPIENYKDHDWNAYRDRKTK